MFNPSEHLVQIRTKQGMQDYLRVQWRIVWFRECCPHGTIETELVKLDLEAGCAVFKAVVTDEAGGMAVGHGSETLADFPDYIEKAETKSVGRALAMLGYGTAFVGEQELSEGNHAVDAPALLASKAS